MISTFSGVDVSLKVTSNRSSIWPHLPHPSSQLYSAVHAPPTCSLPVGDGAKQTLITCVAMRQDAHLSTAGGHDTAHARDIEGAAFREALADCEHCALLLETTAGAKGPLGRTFAELAELIERGGGGDRIGICLDSCHLLASGYEVRTPDAIDALLDECVEA